MGFVLSDKYLKRAGLDYWDKLDIVHINSLDELIEKNSDSTNISYSQGDFLVFGPETRGIPEEILNKNKETCATIPMRKITRSLNLSNSVAIAAYEAFRQFNITKLD